VCGIAGIFDSRDRGEIDRRLLERMNASLFHRGPDAAGLHLEPGLGLAHRRLSIIDLSTGQQPLHYEYLLVRGKRVPEHNPLNPRYRLLIKLWQRPPQSLANRIGPLISRNLG
jgi:asparagine synthetase B (glutamine-hydrolysing)